MTKKAKPAGADVKSGKGSSGKVRPPSPKKRELSAEVHERLVKANPTPHVELKFRSPWELLVAVILSAQSTDKMVNTVTPTLFARWPTPRALADAPQEEVESVIKSTGFFRNKGKAIRESSRMIAEEFGGEVPRTMEEMRTLAGVARKSANVVLGAAYGLPTGITVDTHAMRVSQRLGFTKHVDPEKIEADLCALFPEDQWILTGHRFVLHGRYVCVARKPRCEVCPLNELCPSSQEEAKGTWQERAARVALEMASRAEGFHRAMAR